MTRAIRFHLDENCDPRIAAGLSHHGIDVTTTPEAGLLHAPDEHHLAYAIAQNRVIITQDPDFLRIAASGQKHAGIVFYASQSRTIGQVVRSAHLTGRCTSPKRCATGSNTSDSGAFVFDLVTPRWYKEG